MSENTVVRKIKQGDGVYCISKQQAGAIYKAARDYKVDDVSYWRRKRGKASK